MPRQDAALFHTHSRANCAALKPCVRSRPSLPFSPRSSLGYNDVGWRGANATDIETPVLDSLAHDGLKLEQFYTALVCSPSRAGLLTGRFPYKLGLSHGFIAAGAPYGLPLSEVTMAQDLTAAGYRTAIVGKWHLGMSSWAHTPTYRGFGSHFGFYNGAVHYWAHTHPESNASAPLDFRAGRAAGAPASVVTDRNGTANHSSFASTYGPFVYAAETVRLVQAHHASADTRPLFLFLTHQSTHEPIDAPAEYVERFATKIKDVQRRTFAAMVATLDDAVGSVVAALKSAGFWDDCLVIFHSDNGGNLGAAGNSE